MSYVIDLYRREIRVQKSFVNFAGYVTLFPQLIAGPIVRYSDVEAQINEREISTRKIGDGISIFIRGLAKKFCLPTRSAQSGLQSRPWITARCPLRLRGSVFWLLPSKFIMIFPAIPIWRSGLAKCLALNFHKTLTTPIYLRVSLNFGADGI